MTDAHFIDPSRFLADQLAQASPDLLRSMLATFMQALMGAEADGQCNADYGQRSPERTNSRNGYRPRQLDTRAGTIELAFPELRSGTYFPELAAGAPQTRRESADFGGGDVLPAGCVDPPDGVPRKREVPPTRPIAGHLDCPGADD